MASHGCRIVALVRDFEKASAEMKKALGEDVFNHVEVRADVDFANPSKAYEAFTGVDGVYMIPPPLQNRGELIKGAAYAAEKSGVRHIVLMTTLAGDYDFQREFGPVVDYVVELGVPYTMLEPSVFMENILGSYQSIMEQGAYYSTLDPSLKYADIAVEDIGRAAAHVLTNPSQYENEYVALHGAELLTDAERMEIISKVIGKQVNCVNIPLEAKGAALKGFGLPEWFVDGVSPVATKKRRLMFVCIGKILNLDDSINKRITQHVVVAPEEVETLLGGKITTFEEFAKQAFGGGN